MAILFISGFEIDYKMSSSGGNAVLGIAEALRDYCEEDVFFVCHHDGPSFPKGKFWISGSDVKWKGRDVKYLSTLNIKILKTIHWGWQCVWIIKQWAKMHKGEKLRVLTYNTYHPSISTIHRACRSVGAQHYSILFDLGIPPKRLGLSRMTMLGYKFAEWNAKQFIPQLDGRIVINELIKDYYAPGQHCILVDGGINQNVINHLFPLTVKAGNIYTFVLAGMLWDQNGTKLVLDAMRQYTNPNVRVVFAGKGNDVPLIEAAAAKDTRISYAGKLNMDDLFKLYEQADVLLNLRLEEEVDFHFPGKLLEYLATGRYVISTPVAHAERDYGDYMAVLHELTPEGLVSMMDRVQIMGKKSLYEIGLVARSFMLENRTWDTQTKRILKYIKAN